MPVSPVLKIHMSPSDKGEQFCRLKLELTDVPLPSGEIDAGTLELPFSLEILPSVQRLLNLRQRSSSDSSAQSTPLANESDKEEMLMSLELLDNYGRVYTDVHKRVGQKLGSALLRNQKFKDKLQAFYEAARDAHEGHIVLKFCQEALKLAALPWELVYIESEPLLMHFGASVLLGCTRVIFDQPLSSTRQPEVSFEQTLSSTRLASDKLQILTVASYSDMNDQEQNLEQQARRELQDALSGLPVEIDPLEHVTMSALERRLADGPRVDVLDYYGHGSFEDGYATLRMGGGDGGPELVPAAKLKSLRNLPPLVVLHACNSAQLDIYRLRDSLALNLSEAGVQAVVAMQFEIRMLVVAQHMVSAFYKALANEYSIPKAVAEVRRKLYATEKDAVSWFVPVLYMREFSQQPYLILEQVPAPPPNPFAKGAVNNPKSFVFVDREKQVQQMWRCLQSKGNLSIVGLEGSGKSAMLALIAKEGTRRLKAEVVSLTLEGGWKVDKAKEALAQQMDGKKKEDLTRLLKGKHLILLLDNVEILNESQYGRDIRIWLRGLAENRSFTTVQLVTTSLAPLDETFEDIYQPLHKIINKKIELGPFSKDDGRAFISVRLAGTPFDAVQFEDLLSDPGISDENAKSMMPRNLEDACYDRYEELCERPTKLICIWPK